MSIIIHREAAIFTGELSCAITAIVEPAVLPKLRQQLQPIQGLTVVVSTAHAWGGQRQEHYRGTCVQVDRQVSRVEIACQERDVDAIVCAVRRACASEKAVQQPRGFGAMAAQPGPMS